MENSSNVLEITRVKSLSTSDVVRKLIDSCNWTQSSVEECYNNLSISVILLSRNRQKEILQYYNFKAPGDYKIESLTEFKLKLGIL